MSDYMPWDKSWQKQIVYLPWIQPDIRGMEHSPVLPAYPIFLESLRHGGGGYGFFSAVASAMVFLLGHEPEAPVNALYRDWLMEFNKELPKQLLLEGTDMASKYKLTQAVWMLQASLLLEPTSYETHYNLALAFNNLATKLSREEKYVDASACYRQANQYFENAAQLEDTDFREGMRKADEGHDPSIYREW